MTTTSTPPPSTTAAFHLQAVTVLSRVDQARLDKLLAEHDPFRAESVS